MEVLTETLGINRGGGHGLRFKMLWVRYPAPDLDPTYIFDISGDPTMLSLRGPNSIPEVWVGGYRVVPDSER